MEKAGSQPHRREAEHKTEFGFQRKPMADRSDGPFCFILPFHSVRLAGELMMEEALFISA
jgi:hypothetical protein